MEYKGIYIQELYVVKHRSFRVNMLLFIQGKSTKTNAFQNNITRKDANIFSRNLKKLVWKNYKTQQITDLASQENNMRFPCNVELSKQVFSTLCLSLTLFNVSVNVFIANATEELSDSYDNRIMAMLNSLPVSWKEGMLWM